MGRFILSKMWGGMAAAAAAVFYYLVDLGVNSGVKQRILV